MAEMDRELYAAHGRNGEQLPPNCHRILGLLWTNVDPDEAKRYRKEQGCQRRQAPRVARSLLGPIGRLLQLDPDTVKRLMRLLVAAGYVQSDPRDRRLVALLDQQHRDAFLSSGGGVKDNLGGDLDHPSGDLADERSGDLDRSIEISRMDDREIPIVRSSHPLKVPSLRSQVKGPECRSQAAHTRHSSDLEKSNLEIALDLVRGVVPPEGAARIPATPRGVKHLVELLDEAQDETERSRVVALVEAVLEHAPVLVAGVYESADWYGPHMFGGPWAGWTKALAKWRAHEAAAERARKQRPREASPATLAREALERLVSAIESPPRLSEVDVIGWELLDPSSAAARFRPSAAAAVLAELRAAGELDLAELRLELSKLEVTAQHVQARLVGDVVAGARMSAGLREAPRSYVEQEASEHTALMRRRDEVKRQCEAQLAQERAREAAESRLGGLL